MYCLKCGSPLPEGAEYCPECGTARANAPERERGAAPRKAASALPGICLLAFCCVFAIAGMISLGFFATEGFALRMENAYGDYRIVRTIWLMPSLICSSAVCCGGTTAAVLSVLGKLKETGIASVCVCAAFFAADAITAFVSF